MPMIKDALAAQLLAYFENNEKTPKAAADELAGIIDGYIRTATVSTTVAPGIVVLAPPPTGAGTTTSPGTGTGGLS